MEKLDIAHLRQWIGKTETSTDWLSRRLTASFRATLDEDPGEPKNGDIAPLCVHWLLSPHVVAVGQTGDDGHPRRGGFLPPVALPRRMWAGGEVDLRDLLRVGDEVTKTSRIENVEVKEGSTGTLCFVTVRHEYATKRGLAVRDRHDIVYRDAPKPGEAVHPLPPNGIKQRALRSDAVTLFRYSALGFIGHRIHYDRKYCIEEEGYKGLVVHGPLQATYLMRFAAELKNAPPKIFSYRGVSPMTDEEGCIVNAREDGAGLELWTATRAGRQCMKAKASW